MSNHQNELKYSAADAFAIAYEVVGRPIGDAELLIVWGHGWGQSREAFRALASTFAYASNLLLDFPGFGASAPPPQNWGTAEYADLVATLIAAKRGRGRVLWVGHSFGCRVGIQLAARHPHLVESMCLIAAAGLPRQRSLLQRLQLKARIAAFKVMKRLPTAIIGDVDRLRAKFGSADYRTAGDMRGVFLHVVGEDLTDIAKTVTCRCLLVYGAEDTETPPEIGARLVRLMPTATLCVLPKQDHYSVLAEGRHIVAKRMRQFLDQK